MGLRNTTLGCDLKFLQGFRDLLQLHAYMGKTEKRLLPSQSGGQCRQDSAVSPHRF